MGRGLVGEHGLSFFIEAGKRKVLFDTGQGLALPVNAKALGIDLASVEAVVLSHGHYDHTGGLKALLSVNRRFTLFAHPDAFAHKFSRRDNRVHPIGLSMGQKDLEATGIRVVLSTAPMEVVPGITTTGEIPMETAYERIDTALFTGKCEALQPDPLKDDLSLILHARNGHGVLLGCAHRGVVNILTQVEKINGKKRLLALAGGLHLTGASGARVNRIMEALERFSPEILAPGHCTGFPAVFRLWAAFEENFRLNQVGNVIRI